MNSNSSSLENSANQSNEAIAMNSSEDQKENNANEDGVLHGPQNGMETNEDIQK